MDEQVVEYTTVGATDEETVAESESTVVADGEITLNVDAVLDRMENVGVSLTDLNGLDLFSENITQKIDYYIEKNSSELKLIDEEIFVRDYENEDDILITKIRNQVFSESVEITKQVATDTQQQSALDYSILIIELFIILTLIVGYLYFRKKRKERKKKIDSIDDLYRAL